jgi:hypothetical protein
MILGQTGARHRCAERAKPRTYTGPRLAPPDARREIPFWLPVLLPPRLRRPSCFGSDLEATGWLTALTATVSGASMWSRTNWSCASIASRQLSAVSSQ